MLFLYKKPAFTTLVTQYTKLLYYFARKLSHDQNEVDDIVSETFMKAYKSYPQASFTNTSSIKSWLLSICHNTIRNAYRTAHKQYVLLDEKIEIADGNDQTKLLDMLIQEEQINIIKSHVEKLDPMEQELIHLRIYEELSFKAISRIFEISEASTKMRFYRTLQKLKEAIV